MAECHSSLKVCFQSTGGCADDCHRTAVQLKENHESNKSQPSHEESLPVDLRMFFHHEYKVKQNFNLLNGNWTPKSVWAAQSNASFTAFLEPVERSHCISALTHEAPHVSTTQRAEFSESNWNEITLQSTRLMVWFAAKLGHASANRALHCTWWRTVKMCTGDLGISWPCGWKVQPHSAAAAATRL